MLLATEGERGISAPPAAVEAVEWIERQDDPSREETASEHWSGRPSCCCCWTTVVVVMRGTAPAALLLITNTLWVLC